MKSTNRKIEETSWMAQSIADRMVTASGSKLNCLEALKYIVNKADNNEDGIYWDGKGIIINYIPLNMVNILLGIAARYTDDDGMPILYALTTHDLNSATIKDVGELFYQIRYS